MTEQTPELEASPKSTSKDNEAKVESSLSASKTPDSASSSTSSSSAEKSAAKSSGASERTRAHHNAKATDVKPKSGSSFVAWLALLLSILAIAGIGGAGYLHHLQQQQYHQDVISQNQTQISQLKQQLDSSINQQQQLLAEQKKANAQQLAQAEQSLLQSNQQQINQIQTQVNNLTNRQPSEWLLHEAEYLLRVAIRSIWLERDTNAAAGLLKEADQRLVQLKHPKYLPVRQLIANDIKALELMPTLATEEVTLTLMALSNQIAGLTLAMAQIPDSVEQEPDLELTDDPADWRENLSKTWQRFLQDFVTVRRRSGQVEALMTPQQQSNLKENLALQLEKIQWAARQENPQLYQASIDTALAWLTEYFDLSQAKTENFYLAIEALKQETIAFDFPNNLSSYDALLSVMNETQSVNEEKIEEEETNTNTSENEQDNVGVQ